ncbi:MAG TPA: sigma 54-interacting transcriptional regulator [Terriglobia bacterium]|nr:sigma 54-interacting transcriptional regulator [Terriglobia bacterium]
MAEVIAGVPIRYRHLPPEGAIFGASSSMDELRGKLERVACTDIPILIRGEAGSGKEIIARLIHRRYPGETTPFHKVTPVGRDRWRKSASFVLPRDDTSSDALQGGGAPGKLNCIGSLFFDEVAELNPAAQRSLMHLLHDDRLPGMSAAESAPCLFRVICSTKHDIEREMVLGNFREDLFYSINVVSLHLPPLRARREDIPELAKYFWGCYREEFNSDTREPSLRLIEVFHAYDWPGNIRELANMMKRYVLFGSEERIVEELSAKLNASAVLVPPSSGRLSLKSLARREAQALERKIILKTLHETRWNRKQAARALNISYRTLLYKIKEAGVPPKRTRVKREKPS